MDVQSVATASLLVPALVFGVIAWRARRTGRTTIGVGIRGGGLAELAAGAGWGAVTAAVFLAVFTGTGLVTLDGYVGGWAPWAGIAAYFLVLFLVEEIVFRGFLLTGLGVVVGPVAAVAVTSVLVALPYSFSPATSLLAVIGAVVTNAVNGIARWRTGRIWFGLGWRWVLNVAVVGLGFVDAGFRLDQPVIGQRVTAPAWLSGGGFGPEAGLVGIALELAVIALLVRYTRERAGTWHITPARARPNVTERV